MLGPTRAEILGFGPEVMEEMDVMEKELHTLVGGPPVADWERARYIAGQVASLRVRLAKIETTLYRMEP
jgi:hypothetical protein